MSSFDFPVGSSGWTVQYKLIAQSLRLFGLHSDVNDAHRAGANRLQNQKQTTQQILDVAEGAECFPRNKSGKTL